MRKLPARRLPRLKLPPPKLQDSALDSDHDSRRGVSGSAPARTGASMLASAQDISKVSCTVASTELRAFCGGICYTQAQAHHAGAPAGR